LGLVYRGAMDGRRLVGPGAFGHREAAAKIGFGLWRHVVLSFPLELIVLGLGAWLYARAMAFASARGRYVFWAFVVFLAMLQAYANFGPPPSSPEAMAVTALAFYLVLALLAAWVERMAMSRPM
jgi:hypothetical protein